MRNSKTILDEMKLIDFANQCLKNKIAENMSYREELLREFNEAEDAEKRPAHGMNCKDIDTCCQGCYEEHQGWQQAQFVFIANESGLKEVSKYL